MTTPSKESLGRLDEELVASSRRGTSELYTLGRVQLLHQGAELPVTLGHKHIAILTFLFHERRRVHPLEVADLFRLSHDDEKELAGLKRTVNWLRKNIPFVNIRLTSDACEGVSGIWVDTRDVDAAIEGGNPRLVAELYVGEFLEGFESGYPAFDDWALRERGRLKRAWSHALTQAARQAEEERDWRRAVDWWRILVDRAPLRGEPVARLLDALSRSGGFADAARIYLDYASRLKRAGISQPGEAVARVLAGHPDLRQAVASLPAATEIEEPAGPATPSLGETREASDPAPRRDAMTSGSEVGPTQGSGRDPGTTSVGGLLESLRQLENLVGPVSADFEVEEGWFGPAENLPIETVSMTMKEIAEEAQKGEEPVSSESPESPAASRQEDRAPSPSPESASGRRRPVATSSASRSDEAGPGGEPGERRAERASETSRPVGRDPRAAVEELEAKAEERKRSLYKATESILAAFTDPHYAADDSEGAPDSESTRTEPSKSIASDSLPDETLANQEAATAPAANHQTAMSESPMSGRSTAQSLLTAPPAPPKRRDDDVEWFEAEFLQDHKDAPYAGDETSATSGTRARRRRAYGRVVLPTHHEVTSRRKAWAPVLHETWEELRHWLAHLWEDLTAWFRGRLSGRAENDFEADQAFVWQQLQGEEAGVAGLADAFGIGANRWVDRATAGKVGGLGAHRVDTAPRRHDPPTAYPTPEVGPPKEFAPTDQAMHDTVGRRNGGAGKTFEKHEEPEAEPIEDDWGQGFDVVGGEYVAAPHAGPGGPQDASNLELLDFEPLELTELWAESVEPGALDSREKDQLGTSGEAGVETADDVWADAGVAEPEAVGREAVPIERSGAERPPDGAQPPHDPEQAGTELLRVEPAAVASEYDRSTTEDSAREAVEWFEPDSLEAYYSEAYEEPAASEKPLPELLGGTLLYRLWWVPFGIGLAAVVVLIGLLTGKIGGGDAPAVSVPSLPKPVLPRVRVKAPPFVGTTVDKIGGLFSGPLFERPGEWVIVADLQADDAAAEGGDYSLSALTLALEMDLAQSRFFFVFPRARAEVALARTAGNEPSSRLTVGNARAFAAAEGLGAVIHGNFRTEGDGEVLELAVVDVDGEPQFRVARRVEAAEGRLQTLTILAREVRRKLGEPRESIEESLPAAAILTGSPRGLNAYAEGLDHLEAGRLEEAVDAASVATRADSAFALAYRLMAWALARSGARGRAEQALEAAAGLSPETSEREMFRIRADWLAWTGQLSEAALAYDELFQRYRDDVGALRSQAVVQRKLGALGSGTGNLRVSYMIDPYDWPQLEGLARYLDYNGPLPDVDSLVASLEGERSP